MQEESDNILEDRIIDEGNLEHRRIKFNKWFIIVPIMSIIVIIAIIIIVIELKKDRKDSQQKKDDQEDEIKCQEGEEDNCLKCENNICISCNPKYSLFNNKCISNYSLRAIYESVSDNENVQLVNKAFKYNILDIEVDDIKIQYCYIWNILLQ